MSGNIPENITINGTPLKDYIGEQIGKEIQGVRSSDVVAPLYRASKSKHRANASGARTTPGRVIWEKGQKATQVIVAGNIFDWKDKAPFVTSGHSVAGALEYNQLGDEVKCHVCGGWHRDLARHIARSGNHPNVREYRLKYGFLIKSSLIAPRLRAEYRKRPQHHNPSQNLTSGGKSKEATAKAISSTFAKRRNYGISSRSETFNLSGKCKAQRIRDLQILATELRRTPTAKELAVYVNTDGKHSLRVSCLELLFQVPYRAILIQAGLKPNSRSGIHLNA